METFDNHDLSSINLCCLGCPFLTLVKYSFNLLVNLTEMNRITSVTYAEIEVKNLFPLTTLINVSTG